MRSDDLAPLLAAGPTSGLDFASGRILYFNRATGRNGVRVNGAYLHDLPILNIAASIDLSAGDTVALLRYKSTFFILGRVVVPGEAPLARAALATGSAQADQNGVDLTTSWKQYAKDDPRLSIPVPDGYTSGHAFLMVSVGQTFQAGTVGLVGAQPIIAGHAGPAISSTRGQVAVAQSFMSHSFYGLTGSDATLDLWLSAYYLGDRDGKANYHASASVIFGRED